MFQDAPPACHPQPHPAPAAPCPDRKRPSGRLQRHAFIKPVQNTPAMIGISASLPASACTMLASITTAHAQAELVKRSRTCSSLSSRAKRSGTCPAPAPGCCAPAGRKGRKRKPSRFRYGCRSSSSGCSAVQASRSRLPAVPPPAGRSRRAHRNRWRRAARRPLRPEPFRDDDRAIRAGRRHSTSAVSAAEGGSRSYRPSPMAVSAPVKRR